MLDYIIALTILFLLGYTWLNRRTIPLRLCIMMFLQFFVWGAWFSTVGPFMEAHGMGAISHYAYMVGPFAAIISPFLLGMVADRFFATEKVLAVMCFLGGLALLAAPMAAQASPWLFIGVLLAHTLCYMPTLGLTNTLAFHNLTNQEKQFPMIRVFGTVGWIAAGWVVSLLKVDAKIGQFYVAAACGLVLAAFSLFLPHTPPPAKGKKISAREILGLDALALLKNPSFLVFMIGSFLTCIPLAAYFSYTGRFLGAAGIKEVGATMSVGQIVEMVFMFLMPLFFARLGVKWMLAMGMLAWVLRYGLFAAAANTGLFPLVVGGIALHGICYDFFFVTGFIYTDKRASKDIRGQAQGLLVLVTQGLGMLIGAQLAGLLFNNIVGNATGPAALSLYQKFWLIPGALAAVVLLLFLALFRDDSKETPAEPREAEVVEAQQA